MAGKLGEMGKRVSAAGMGGIPVLVLKEVRDGTAAALGG